ncbi:hypothetical protein ACFZB9_22665 [Kitasatospora sp. NPDC008050]
MPTAPSQDRSLAINRLRAAGHTDVVAAIREMSYHSFTRPLGILRIG